MIGGLRFYNLQDYFSCIISFSFKSLSMSFPRSYEGASLSKETKLYRSNIHPIAFSVGPVCLECCFVNIIS